MGGSRGKPQRAGAGRAGRPRGVLRRSPPDHPRVDSKRDAPSPPRGVPWCGVPPPRHSLGLPPGGWTNKAAVARPSSLGSVKPSRPAIGFARFFFRFFFRAGLRRAAGLGVVGRRPGGRAGRRGRRVARRGADLALRAERRRGRGRRRPSALARPAPRRAPAAPRRRSRVAGQVGGASRP